jgi:hypothetical protein
VAGQVTIGLASQDQSALGVHWCLSLAHLSYYGASKPITRSLPFGDPKCNRLTLLDFTLVLFGGFVGLWNSEENIERSQALEIMILAIYMVKKGLDGQSDKSADAEPDILDHFADAMSRYQTHTLTHDDSTTKLVDLGVRYKNFFKLKEPRLPSYIECLPCFRLFGMNDLYFGTGFAQQEDRLTYSRSIAPKMLKESAQDPSATMPCFLLVFKYSEHNARKAFFTGDVLLKTLRPLQMKSRSN